MILVLKVDLDMVKMYHPTKIEDYMLRHSKVITQTDRQTDRQTDGQTKRQTGRHTDRHTVRKHYPPTCMGGNKFVY